MPPPVRFPTWLTSGSPARGEFYPIRIEASKGVP